MSYKHRDEMIAVADAVLDVVKMLKDEIANAQQIPQFLADAMSGFSASDSALRAEVKPKFRAKFAAYVGLEVLGRVVANQLPLSQVHKDSIAAAIKTIKDILDAELPDEP